MAGRNDGDDGGDNVMILTPSISPSLRIDADRRRARREGGGGGDGCGSIDDVGDGALLPANTAGLGDGNGDGDGDDVIILTSPVSPSLRVDTDRCA